MKRSHAFIALGISGHFAQAAVIAEWDGVGGASVAGVTTVVEITSVGDLTRGEGLGTVGSSNFNSNNWGNTSSSFTTAVADEDYLTWSITVAPGFQITDLSVSAEIDTSSTGPNSSAWAIDTGSGFSQIGATFEGPDPGAVVTSDTVSGPLSGTITFALVGWDASGTSGTLDLEDDLIGGGTGNVGLQINGDISVAIPEPSTVLLGGLALLGLLRRKR